MPAVTLSAIVIVFVAFCNVIRNTYHSRMITGQNGRPRTAIQQCFYLLLLIFTKITSHSCRFFTLYTAFVVARRSDDENNNIEWRTISYTFVSSFYLLLLLHNIIYFFFYLWPLSTVLYATAVRPTKNAKTTAADHAAFRTCRSAEPGIFESPVCVLF